MEQPSLKCGIARPPSAAGFSLMELMLAIALVAGMLAVGVPAYQGYLESARQTTAATDIQRIEQVIAKYEFTHSKLPPSLTEINEHLSKDPWGQPYVYLPLTGPGTIGQARKDRNLVPLNSDYDLYSIGKDADSQPPLAVPVSKDDIIRANNGRYIGLAENY